MHKIKLLKFIILYTKLFLIIFFENFEIFEM